MVQMEVFPSQIQKNLNEMLRQIAEARSEGYLFIAFPEMCLSGYLIGDRWEIVEFIDELQEAHETLRKASRGMLILWGSVLRDASRKGEDGRVRLFNAWFACRDGEWHSTCEDLIATPKVLLPNYRLFDESRYFYDLRKWAFELGKNPAELLKPLNIDGEKVGVILCEDGWDDDYAFSPIKVLCEKGAQWILNLSCSPFSLGKSEKRDRLFREKAQTHKVPIVYLNAFSVQNTGKTFYLIDGDSLIFPLTGKEPLHTLTWAKPGTFEFDSERAYSSFDTRPDENLRILKALQVQLAFYLKEAGLQRVVIGASGGIDSAVNAALVASVVGPENLLLVNMPSRYNSDLTKGLAADLACNIGCWYTEVSIEESVELTRRQMGSLEIHRKNEVKRVTLSEFHFENVQARDRSARILSALACSFGGVFTCNANKAEMSVGYSTLYGDLGGFLAPLADLWKYQVYQLGRDLNQWSLEKWNACWIPEGVFTVVPSAELSDQQDVNQGKGDPLIYPYHDYLFKAWVEGWQKAGLGQILEWFQNGVLEEKLGMASSLPDSLQSPRAFIADLERWYVLFCGLGQVKRIQSPPILAISRRPFGFDWREAVLKPYYSKKFLDLRGKLTEKESL